MDKLDLIIQKLETLENGQEQTNERLKVLETDLSKTRAEVKDIRKELGETRAEVKGIRKELGETQAEVKDIRKELDVTGKTLEDKIDWVKLDMENRIYPAINVIAENHIESTKRLGKVLDIKERVDFNTIRISMLETAVRDLKEDMKMVKHA